MTADAPLVVVAESYLQINNEMRELMINPRQVIVCTEGYHTQRLRGYESYNVLWLGDPVKPHHHMEIEMLLQSLGATFITSAQAKTLYS